jgi:hypothetical protein
MPKFVQGKYNLQNPDKYVGNRTPTYRSSWEFAFMRFCDNHPNVNKWASEAIRIPYRNPFTGKYTIYVPDFFISYVDANGKSHAEVIEVKPLNHTIKEKLGRSKSNQAHYVLNQAKWEAARAWCKQQNITFRIVSEEDIFHQGKKR